MLVDLMGNVPVAESQARDVRRVAGIHGNTVECYLHAALPYR